MKRLMLSAAAAALLSAQGAASAADYTFALVMIGSDVNKTVPLGLASMIGAFDLRWGDVMAGSTLIALPLFIAFILLSRYFVQGLTAGAVKG